jgi:hypothetical protein
MSKILYACINQCTQKDQNDNEWEELKINNQSIRFLQDPLLNNRFQAHRKVKGDSEYWHLTFFANTQYQIDLSVLLTNTRPEKPSEIRAIWQTCAKDPSPSQAKEASDWLRSSKSLTLEKYLENAGRWYAMDGNGFSMISPPVQEDTFRRTVVLLALAHAYRLGIEALMNELSVAGNNANRVKTLALRASEFNAHCYFRYPVKLRHNTLVEVWEAIANRLHIRELNQELIEQTRQLHELMDAEKQYQEQRRWQRLGLLLSLISALQVISLFPEETRRQWWIKLVSILGL